MPRRLTFIAACLLCLGIGTLLSASPKRLPGIRQTQSAETFSVLDAIENAPLQILALRVEFIADDVKTTTGNGRFDLGTQSEYSLDRPPHNRSYFQEQIQALRNYFVRVSSGKVDLRADVFPAAEEAAYQLGHDMVYYSGMENETLQEQRRAELLRDAVLAAAADPAIDFSKYHYLMVFHAGVGQDFAFDFDTSPFDIQSVYIDFTALHTALEPGNKDYKGIPCPGDVHVREGIILPETQNQENIDLGLLGSMTLLFGSQIGMPSLFDTESGRAGIGRWGLMDQGSYNFQGFIPAQPSAWEKVYMGWEEPVVVQNAAQVRIGAAAAVSAPHIIKVPISANEYFLIENRQRDPNRDKVTIGRDRAGNRAEFDSTGRVVASAGIGVITSIDEYDYGLPGSGLLIWHIDENVIAARLADNAINNNREHRGVDLVECDGAQDIGYVYDMFDLGYGTENGDYWDPYWAGNESHTYVNESNQVAFSAYSIPNSDAHGGAKTFITLNDFSRLDSVMTVSIYSDLLAEGFPRYEAAGLNFSPAALLAVPGSNGAPGALFAATPAGQVFAWKGNGSTVSPFSGYEMQPLKGSSVPLLCANLDGDNFLEVIAVDDEQGIMRYHLLATGVSAEYTMHEGAQRTAAMILPQPGNATAPALVTGASNGTVEIFACAGAGTPLQKTKSLTLGSSRINHLAWFPQGAAQVIALAADQTLYACDLANDAIVWRAAVTAASATPLVADFDGDAQLEVAVVAANGALQIFSADGQLKYQHQPLQLLHDITAPALGDLDQDGLPEILCNSREGFYAFEASGASVLNFPVTTYAADSAATVMGAVFAWKKEGESAMVIAPAPDGRITAWDQVGIRLERFPVSSGSALATIPVLADLQGQGTLNMAAINRDGDLMVWNLGVSAREYQVWGQYGGDGRTFYLQPSEITTPPGTSELMPAKSVFCYPNPVSSGTAVIRFTLNRDCEEVAVRIFDLAANYAGELKAMQLAAGDHELLWNVDAVQSGVYLAKVQARAADGTAFQIIKIAVTK